MSKDFNRDNDDDGFFNKKKKYDGQENSGEYRNRSHVENRESRNKSDRNDNRFKPKRPSRDFNRDKESNRDGDFGKKNNFRGNKFEKNGSSPRPFKKDFNNFKDKDFSKKRDFKFGKKDSEFGEKKEFRREPREFNRESRGESRDFRREPREFNRESRGESRDFRREPREFNRESRGESREFRREPREFNRESRGESREFRREPREFSGESRGESREFRREPREFNREPREFRGESRDFRREPRAPRDFSSEKRFSKPTSNDVDFRPFQNDDAKKEFGFKNSDSEFKKPFGFKREGREERSDFAPRKFNDRDSFQSRPNKPFDKPFGKPSNRQVDEFSEIIDIDRGILKLVAKRARFFANLVEEKKIDSKTEKEIRLAWEGNAAKFCRDPKASRQLYLLLQDIEAIAENALDMPHFNLSPAPSPVQIELQAPASSRLAMFYFVLVAFSGQETSMKNIPLTDSVIDGIKSLHALGGGLWYENDGTVISKISKGLERGSDKIVHAGKNELALWLCVALSLGLQYHVKITGENELRQVDFSPLAPFLPELGARFVQVIPSQTGLPIRIESSGVLPEEIDIPENLPQDFVLALLLASNFWDSPVRMNLTNYLASINADEAKKSNWDLVYNELCEIMEICQVPLQREQDIFYCSPKTPVMPKECNVPSDAEISALFFLYPALISGYVKLEGNFDFKGRQEILKPIMNFASLDFEVDKNAVTSKGSSDSEVNIESLDKINCSMALKTLFYLLILQKNKDIESLPNLDEFLNLTEEDVDTKTLITGFFERIGFDQDMNKTDPIDLAFTAPSPDWAIVYSLAAYYRPRLQLVNPNIMNDYYPFYWRMYNTLPRPELKKQEKKKEDSSRKRIIAKGAFAENLPAYKYEEDE